MHAYDGLSRGLVEAPILEPVGRTPALALEPTVS